MKNKVFLCIVVISLLMIGNVGSVLAETWNVIILNHKFKLNDEADATNLAKQAINIDAETQEYEYNGIIKANKTNVLHIASLEKDDIITVELKVNTDDLLGPQVPIKNSKGFYSHILNFTDKKINTYTVSEKDYYKICIYNPNANKSLEYSIIITINGETSNGTTDKNNFIENQQIIKTEVSFDKFNLKNEIWYGPYTFHSGNIIQSYFNWHGTNNLQLAIVTNDPGSYDNTFNIILLKNNLQDVYEIVEDGEYYIILSADTASTSYPDFSYLENVKGYFESK